MNEITYLVHPKDRAWWLPHEEEDPLNDLVQEARFDVENGAKLIKNRAVKADLFQPKISDISPIIASKPPPLLAYF